MTTETFDDFQSGAREGVRLWNDGITCEGICAAADAPPRDGSAFSRGMKFAAETILGWTSDHMAINAGLTRGAAETVRSMVQRAVRA